jgi:copper transport protein
LVAAILARFSQLAVVAVIVIMTTGLIQAYIEVRSVPNLFDTAFGRAVLIKFCLLLSLIALGAFNRRRSVPRLRALAESGAPPGRTGLLLRRALRTEVALIAVVLGVPRRSVATRPRSPARRDRTRAPRTSARCSSR